MERQKVSEIARKLGVSCQSVYKKLSKGDTRLTPHIHKEGSATYLDKEGFSILSEMFGKGSPKPVSPVDNQVENMVTIIKKQLDEKQGIIEAQQRTIESLISQSEESRKRTDTILMKLTNDISVLQKCLEYKPTFPTQAANSERLSNSQKEDTPRRSAPPISCQVDKREPVQRELSLWESVQLTFDDCMGFFLGRG